MLPKKFDQKFWKTLGFNAGIIALCVTIIITIVVIIGKTDKSTANEPQQAILRSEYIYGNYGDRYHTWRITEEQNGKVIKTWQDFYNEYTIRRTNFTISEELTVAPNGLVYTGDLSKIETFVGTFIYKNLRVEICKPKSN